MFIYFWRSQRFGHHIKRSSLACWIASQIRKKPDVTGNKAVAYVRFATEEEADRADWAGPHNVGGGDVIVKRVVSPRVSLCQCFSLLSEQLVLQTRCWCCDNAVLVPWVGLGTTWLKLGKGLSWFCHHKYSWKILVKNTQIFSWKLSRTSHLKTSSWFMLTNADAPSRTVVAQFASILPATPHEISICLSVHITDQYWYCSNSSSWY